MNLFDLEHKSTNPITSDVMYVEQDVEWDVFPAPSEAAITEILYDYLPSVARGRVVVNCESRGVHNGKYWFATKLKDKEQDRYSWVYVQVPIEIIRGLPS